MSLILPRGRIERIYLHWSGGDYHTTFPSYHYCVGLRAGQARAENTSDLRANMRDVREADSGSYTAHTQGRNSFAAGLAALGMQGATPADFGAYPLTEAQVDALCALAAQIARAYGIPVDAEHVLTHAEAAVADGYFGSNDDERWDIARLVPSDLPLSQRDARETGDALREKIRAF
jgi:hypothetical protein